MSHILKRFLKTTLQLALTVLVVLLATELFLRFFVFRKYLDKYLIYPPNIKTTTEIHLKALPGISGITTFITNDLGLRSDPVPKEAYKILTLGGSTTECSALDQLEAWPQIVQKKLQKSTGQSVWVGNAGANKLAVENNIVQTRYVVSQLDNVHIVIAMVGVNDFLRYIYNPDSYTVFDTNNNNASIRKYFFHYPQPGFSYKNSALFFTAKYLKTKLHHMKWNLKKQFFVSRRLDRQNTKNVRYNLPHMSQGLAKYRQNLNTLIDTAESMSVEIVLVTQPYLWKKRLTKKELVSLWLSCHETENYCYDPGVLAEGMKTFNEILLSVCKNRKIRCIDLEKEIDKNLQHFYDDVHFNENGARKVAEIVSDFIIQNSQL